MSAARKRLIDLSHWHDPATRAIAERGHHAFGKLSDSEFLDVARVFFAIVLDAAPFLTECRRRFGGLEAVLLRLGFDRRNKLVPGYMREVYETLHAHSEGLALDELVARARERSGSSIEGEELDQWLSLLPQFFESRGRWFASDYFPLLFTDYGTHEARMALRSLVSKVLERREGDITIGAMMSALFPSMPATAGGALREALRQVSWELGFTNQHDRDALRGAGHGSETDEERHLSQDLESLARHFARAIARSASQGPAARTGGDRRKRKTAA